jgi:hypothetical protein
MDEASRGPLGAIKVLAKWAGGPLATLGAVITVCMIAFCRLVEPDGQSVKHRYCPDFEKRR